jgi:hypothetical protein
VSIADDKKGTLRLILSEIFIPMFVSEGKTDE